MVIFFVLFVPGGNRKKWTLKKAKSTIRLLVADDFKMGVRYATGRWTRRGDAVARPAATDAPMGPITRVIATVRAVVPAIAIDRRVVIRVTNDIVVRGPVRLVQARPPKLIQNALNLSTSPKSPKTTKTTC
jgi:hypothetical protein